MNFLVNYGREVSDFVDSDSRALDLLEGQTVDYDRDFQGEFFRVYYGPLVYLSRIFYPNMSNRLISEKCALLFLSQRKRSSVEWFIILVIGLSQHDKEVSFTQTIIGG